MKHQDVRGVARDGTEQHGGVRGEDRGRRFGGAGLVAAVAAGCAVAALATGPSWALHRPGPRPAVDVVAPGTPGTSGAPEVSTLPALVAAPSDSDLQVVRIDPDPAPPGGSTVVHGFVGNGGPDTTASPFTVTVDLPPGVTATGPYFPADCQVLLLGRRVRCVFGPGLKEGRSATALVRVNLSPTLPSGERLLGEVSVQSPDDRHRGNNRTPFEITVE
ncbi:hypothetical protein [Kitasatospora sp. NPDC086791]|uniref:hypothetical protein n=1 Tax=Kitasatospora sp. NPDC086791 TaxID=3155178 RepID=UPI00343E7BEB